MNLKEVCRKLIDNKYFAVRAVMYLGNCQALEEVNVKLIKEEKYKGYKEYLKEVKKYLFESLSTFLKKEEYELFVDMFPKKTDKNMKKFLKDILFIDEKFWDAVDLQYKCSYDDLSNLLSEDRMNDYKKEANKIKVKYCW